jgi:hypothetical protein
MFPLWLSGAWRRMMMSDQPFTVVVEEKHGEARRSRHRLTLFRPGKLIKAANDYGVIPEHECAPSPIVILFPLPLSGAK